MAAISVSIIGILLGPMFPVAINHTARVLPRHLVNGTIGWISACGAGGSALLPFITGAMASKLGIESLQPLCVFQLIRLVSCIHQFFFLSRLLAMMVILGTLWVFVPKERKITC